MSAVPERRFTILLAEDEESLLHLLTLLLGRAGYRVLPASDGSEAIKLFRQSPNLVDLLITDIDMPGISGVELANIVRSAVPRCPVLIISGLVRPFDDARPDWPFLSKPFHVDEFLRIVRDLLPAAPHPPQPVRPRIVLAEDDGELRLRLCRLLSRDYDVVAVAEGPAALKSASELHPEVVVLDIGMPGMNGFEVARQLRESMPSLPVLFVTQHSDPVYVQEAFACGGAGYLLKRNLARELTAALEKVRTGGRYLSDGLAPA
jgi:CheY-like chemotaxis protein